MCGLSGPHMSKAWRVLALALAAAPLAEGATLCGKFFDSLADVTCRRGLAAMDRGSIALENARISARGSIRKQQCSLSPASVLKTWNATAAQQEQVTGNKRMCCLALLERAPPEGIRLLLSHVSDFGADQACFPEDAFANHKLLPGRPSGCPDWFL